MSDFQRIVCKNRPPIFIKQPKRTTGGRPRVRFDIDIKEEIDTIHSIYLIL